MRITLGAGGRLGLAFAAVIAVTASCGSSGSTTSRPAQVKVVASVFPLAEVARQVGGPRVAVTDLTPTGVEPANVPVSSAEVGVIEAADVVLEIGNGFQPEIERAAANNKVVLAVLPAVGGDDPHVWLDPVLMQRITALVGDALSSADPAGAKDYRRGVREFTARLGALDIDYHSSLADCARKDLVTSQQAFGRLASRYGLVEDAIADPARLAPLIDLVKAKGITTAFIEPLVSTTAAESLAHLAHVRLEVLDPIDGLTAAEQSRGATYVSLMADNLAKLRSALACTSGTPT